jgi:hypothetical protein
MTATDELVEVMARAAHETGWIEGDPPWADLVGFQREIYLSEARAALTALRAKEGEMGWQCVPMAPTEKMLGETQITEPGYRRPPSARIIEEYYRAMLSASPTPPGSE